jgi:hypothetical protein
MLVSCAGQATGPAVTAGWGGLDSQALPARDGGTWLPRQAAASMFARLP